MAGRLSPGEPCLARYSLDNSIYRAVVLKSDSSSAKVFFIDYGRLYPVLGLKSYLTSPLDV